MYNMNNIEKFISKVICPGERTRNGSAVDSEKRGFAEPWRDAVVPHEHKAAYAIAGQHFGPSESRVLPPTFKIEEHSGWGVVRKT
jgi:hypothetical protein